MKIFATGGSTILKTLRREARRWLLWPPVGGIDLGDPDRVRPISEDWGFDRGQPVDRYFIESFLFGHATDIRGRVLEVLQHGSTVPLGLALLEGSTLAARDPLSYPRFATRLLPKYSVFRGFERP